MTLLHCIEFQTYEEVRSKEISRPVSGPDWDLAKTPFVYEYWGAKTGLVCTERRYHGGEVKRDWPDGQEREVWQYDFLSRNLERDPEPLDDKGYPIDQIYLYD